MKIEENNVTIIGFVRAGIRRRNKRKADMARIAELFAYASKRMQRISAIAYGWPELNGGK